MWWLLACNQYQLTPEPEAPGPPDLRVSPTEVVFSGVCTTEHRDVVLENRGESALTVHEVEVEGSGWSVSHPTLPAEIAPGTALNLEVGGTAGPGTLTLRTDDPDTPEVVVPLAATANEAPVVYITAPYESQVLDPDVPFVLGGLVADEESAPTALVAEWRTDRAGVLGTCTPDEDGRVSLPWPDALRLPGPVVIELVVTDPCDTPGEASLYVCQDGAWEVDSLAVDAWRTEGDAEVDQVAARATLGPGAGSAFDAYLTFDAELVTAEFDVTGTGAGFVFTLLDPARVVDWLGAGGCGLGLGAATCTGPGLPGWAVVFDTLAGDGNDCAAPPSVSLVVDGDLAAPLACVALPTPLGGGHVRVVSADGAVEVRVDDRVVLDAPLPSSAIGTAYAGFTGVGDWTVQALTLTDSRCDR